MIFILRCCIVLLVMTLTGCASTAKNPQDPLEGFNRTMFDFNDKLDKIALKPAATVYKNTVPDVVQSGVGNFFGNLADIPTAMNNFLQFRFADGTSDVGRVVINSICGIGGFFDVASPKLPKHDQDFGQTLGRWGFKSGPYLVLPLIGPTTMRDALAMPVDLETDPWSYKYPVRWRNTGSVIRLIDHRAYILDTSTLIEDAALDRYEFVRDAYLQRRQSKIYTGDTPKQDSDSDGGVDQNRSDSTDSPGGDAQSN